MPAFWRAFCFLRSLIGVPRKVAAYTKSQLLRKQEEWNEASGPDQAQAVHQFPDGWSIKKLDTPHSENYEGELMGNCVGSQSSLHNSVSPDQWHVPRESDDKNFHLYSVRDPDNIPHATFSHGDDVDSFWGLDLEGRSGSNAAKYAPYAHDWWLSKGGRPADPEDWMEEYGTDMVPVGSPEHQQEEPDQFRKMLLGGFWHPDGPIDLDEPWAEPLRRAVKPMRKFWDRLTEGEDLGQIEDEIRERMSSNFKPDVVESMISDVERDYKEWKKYQDDQVEKFVRMEMPEMYWMHGAYGPKVYDVIRQFQEMYRALHWNHPGSFRDNLADQLIAKADLDPSDAEKIANEWANAHLKAQGQDEMANSEALRNAIRRAEMNNQDPIAKMILMGMHGGDKTLEESVSKLLDAFPNAEEKIQTWAAVIANQLNMKFTSIPQYDDVDEPYFANLLKNWVGSFPSDAPTSELKSQKFSPRLESIKARFKRLAEDVRVFVDDKKELNEGPPCEECGISHKAGKPCPKSMGGPTLMPEEPSDEDFFEWSEENPVDEDVSAKDDPGNDGGDEPKQSKTSASKFEIVWVNEDGLVSPEWAVSQFQKELSDWTPQSSEPLRRYVGYQFGRNQIVFSANSYMHHGEIEEVMQTSGQFYGYVRGPYIQDEYGLDTETVELIQSTLGLPKIPPMSWQEYHALDGSVDPRDDSTPKFGSANVKIVEADPDLYDREDVSRAFLYRRPIAYVDGVVYVGVPGSFHRSLGIACGLSPEDLDEDGLPHDSFDGELISGGDVVWFGGNLSGWTPDEIGGGFEPYPGVNDEIRSLDSEWKWKRDNSPPRFSSITKVFWVNDDDTVSEEGVVDTKHEGDEYGGHSFWYLPEEDELWIGTNVNVHHYHITGAMKKAGRRSVDAASGALGGWTRYKRIVSDFLHDEHALDPYAAKITSALGLPPMPPVLNNEFDFNGGDGDDDNRFSSVERFSASEYPFTGPVEVEWPDYYFENRHDDEEEPERPIVVLVERPIENGTLNTVDQSAPASRIRAFVGEPTSYHVDMIAGCAELKSLYVDEAGNTPVPSEDDAFGGTPLSEAYVTDSYDENWVNGEGVKRYLVAGRLAMKGHKWRTGSPLNMYGGLLSAEEQSGILLAIIDSAKKERLPDFIGFGSDDQEGRFSSANALAEVDMFTWDKIPAKHANPYENNASNLPQVDFSDDKKVNLDDEIKVVLSPRFNEKDDSPLVRRPLLFDPRTKTLTIGGFDEYHRDISSSEAVHRLIEGEAYTSDDDASGWPHNDTFVDGVSIYWREPNYGNEPIHDDYSDSNEPAPGVNNLVRQAIQETFVQDDSNKKFGAVSVELSDTHGDQDNSGDDYLKNRRPVVYAPRLERLFIGGWGKYHESLMKEFELIDGYGPAATPLVYGEAYITGDDLRWPTRRLSVDGVAIYWQATNAVKMQPERPWGTHGDPEPAPGINNLIRANMGEYDLKEENDDFKFSNLFQKNFPETPNAEVHVIDTANDYGQHGSGSDWPVYIEVNRDMDMETLGEPEVKPANRLELIVGRRDGWHQEIMDAFGDIPEDNWWKPQFNEDKTITTFHASRMSLRGIDPFVNGDPVNTPSQAELDELFNLAKEKIDFYPLEDDDFRFSAVDENGLTGFQIKSPNMEEHGLAVLPPLTRQSPDEAFYYHVAPSQVRNSIQEEGLQAQRNDVDREWNHETFSQPRGNYFYDSLKNAEAHANWMFWREENSGDYDEYGEVQAREGNSYDIWEARLPSGSVVKADPETVLSEESDWMTFPEAYKNLEEKRGPNESLDDVWKNSSDIMRWYTDQPVSPESLRLVETINEYDYYKSKDFPEARDNAPYQMTKVPWQRFIGKRAKKLLSFFRRGSLRVIDLAESANKDALPHPDPYWDNRRPVIYDYETQTIYIGRLGDFHETLFGTFPELVSSYSTILGEIWDDNGKIDISWGKTKDEPAPGVNQIIFDRFANPNSNDENDDDVKFSSIKEARPVDPGWWEDESPNVEPFTSTSFPEETDNAYDYVYHRTDWGPLVNGIKQKGLIPWDSDENSTGSLYGGNLTPRSGHIYFMEADRVSDFEYRKHALLRVRRSKLDPQLINPDEDFLFDPQNLHHVNTDLANKQRERIDNDDIDWGTAAEEIDYGNDPQDTADSIETGRTLAYKGSIAPQDLEVYFPKNGYGSDNVVGHKNAEYVWVPISMVYKTPDKGIFVDWNAYETEAAQAV